MNVAITFHAAARMQQRAIPANAIELLLKFGTSMRCRGADTFFFDRKARHRLAAVLCRADLRRAEKYLNTYAVVADDGWVITAAQRTRRLRRHLQDREAMRVRRRGASNRGCAMTRHGKCSATKKEFVQTIASLIDESGKSQIEIARALNYENANPITMFKKGTTRIPPEQVVPFAYVIEQDPGLLLRDWFAAYMPDVLPYIERYWPRWT